MPGHQIFVKDTNGKSHAFELADHGGLSCTVATLKELVHDKIGPAPDTQRLVFAGKEMEDDSTLEECMLPPAGVLTTVHLVFRLRGGSMGAKALAAIFEAMGSNPPRTYAGPTKADGTPDYRTREGGTWREQQQQRRVERSLQQEMAQASKPAADPTRRLRQAEDMLTRCEALLAGEEAQPAGVAISSAVTSFVAWVQATYIDGAPAELAVDRAALTRWADTILGTCTAHSPIADTGYCTKCEMTFDGPTCEPGHPRWCHLASAPAGVELQDCMICCEEKRVGDRHYPVMCGQGHARVACSTCIQMDIGTKVKAKANYGESARLLPDGFIPCMQCMQMLQPKDLRRLAAPADFARWSDGSSRAFIESLPAFRYCGRAGCGAGAEHLPHAKGAAISKVSCQTCSAALCFNHQRAGGGKVATPWHHGLSCAQFEAKIVAATSVTSEQQVDADVLAALGLKACPGCCASFERDGGSTSIEMDCPVGGCGTKFSWCCLTKWERAAGGSWTAVHAPSCFHYDQAAFAENEILAALTAGATMACPWCGGQGVKDDACTHITLTKGMSGCACAHGKTWCYTCGQKAEDVNLEPGRRGGHNQTECPWYLYEHPAIGVGPEACKHQAMWQLQRFHQLKTTRLLSECRATIEAEAPGVFDGVVAAKPALLHRLLEQKDEAGAQLLPGVSITLEQIVNYSPVVPAGSYRMP